MTQCPHCHASLSIPETLAGRSVSCPSCKGAFTAPSPAPQAATAPAISLPSPASHAPSSSAGGRYSRPKKDSSGLIVGLLIVNLVFSGIAAGWCLLAEYRLQSIGRAMRESVDQFKRDMEDGPLGR